MKLPIRQVDAFSRGVFTGNPAAVVRLDEWLPDATLLAIAAENNLAETAFLRGTGGVLELRWFTPTIEVALCGHATLASGCVVLDDHPELDEVAFETRKSGRLTVTRAGDTLTLRLPRLDPVAVEMPEGLADALGATPDAVLRAHYTADEWDDFAVFEQEADIAALAPDMRALARLGGDRASRGVICTAPAAEEGDFVSRYFAPAAGIDEDPFTGSAHCVLTPYWAERLGEKVLEARQISARVGWATCTLEEEAVTLTGRAATYLRGEIEIGDHAASANV
ncbi:putative isomerase YddE [Jannaschia seosinensis]|uniref:Putative isomerase YddE n=1 Tax=Jannaschia seosinensis TaxID=313367 RepID=A0A0M7BEA5_9RHOB|nr:PhzF family phenazine biosynthesis protein [Jannaschia seosinensis]CUH39695.1 putative isomerase YddE [Jannaschia seosinensis]